jgi:hypothetical protein
MGALLSVPMAAMGAALAAPMAMLSAAMCCCTGLSCACNTISCIRCCFQPATGKRTGVSPRLAKVLYIFLFGLSMIAALILRFNSENFNLGPLTVNCSSSNATVNASGLSTGTYVYCKGDAAVFRISFILVLFFLAMGLLSLVSDGAHRGFWFFKVTVLLGGMIGSFFMPNSAFDNSGYAWVARFGAGIFLILQILVLIDFGYHWNEMWVAHAYEGTLTEYDEATNKNWLIAILVCAILLYMGTITATALVYVYYPCGTGIAFNTVVFLLSLAVTVISLFRDKLVGVEGAVLPAAVVVAYAVYLVWSSLQSNPDATCRPASSDDAASITVGALIATTSLCWTSFSLTGNAEHLMKGEELEKPPETTTASVTPVAGAPVSSTQYRGDAEAGHNQGSDDEDEYLPSTEKAWVFHLLMITASMYLAMLLTDWGTESGGASATGYGEGAASMGVKFAAALMTVFLYAWTLVAPVLVQGRDFS